MVSSIKIWCNMRLVVWLSLLLVSGLAALAECPDGKKQCWVVMGIVGKWKAKPSERDLSFGDGVNPDTLVWNPSKTPSAFITLVWDESNKFPCEDSRGCKVTWPQKSTGSPSFLTTLLALGKRPNRYIAAVSRDYGSLRDGVVRMNENSADLAPVFADLGKGDYRFKIDRVQPGSDQVIPFGNGPIMVSWDPNRYGSGSLSLTPGLYRIQITNAQGEATGSDAWALVRRTQDYDKAKASFDEIVNQTASWHEDVPASGIHALYRARLEALSQ